MFAIRQTGQYRRYMCATLRQVRRVRELKAFAKTKLAPGETKTLSMTLESEAFTIWNLQMKEVLEHGEFEILLMDQGKVWDRQIIVL